MISLPRIMSRRAYVMAALGFMFPVVFGIVSYIVWPEHRVAALVSMPILEIAFIALWAKSIAFDPQSVTIVTTYCFVWRRRLSVREVHQIGIKGNNAGAALLVLQTPRRKVLIPVLMLIDDIKKSRDPQQLLMLAQVIEQFVPATVQGRDDVCAALRTQAAYVGPAEASPLAPLVRDYWLKVGAQVADMITVGKLLD